MPTEPVAVARVEDVPADRGLHVVAHGQHIVVFILDGEPHAFGAWCPHQFADLSDGWIEDGYLVCSNHLWCFSLADGSMPSNDVIKLPVYETRLEDGWVMVEVTP